MSHTVKDGTIRSESTGARPMRLATITALLLASCSPGVGPSAIAPTGPSTSGAPSARPEISSLPSVSASTLPTVVLPGSVLHDRTSGNDVHTIYLLEGGVDKPLTSAGEYQLLVVAPDHTKMLVMPGGDIAAPVVGGSLDLDGTHFSLLDSLDPTLNLVPGAWSPDGKRIAFLGWDDTDPSRTGVYTARESDGGDLVRVTKRPGLLFDSPLDYSPDGKSLVFYRAAHPDPDSYVGGSLWTVKVDGSGERQINGSARPGGWARWSPDGSAILFPNERTSPTGALWTVSPDGSNLVQLFVDPGRGFPITPTWSEDGSLILFATSLDNDQFRHTDNVFAVIDADGTNLRHVAGTSGFNREPEWWN